MGLILAEVRAEVVGATVPLSEGWRDPAELWSGAFCWPGTVAAGDGVLEVSRI